MKIIKTIRDKKIFSSFDEYFEFLNLIYFLFLEITGISQFILFFTP